MATTAGRVLLGLSMALVATSGGCALGDGVEPAATVTAPSPPGVLPADGVVAGEVGAELDSVLGSPQTRELVEPVALVGPHSTVLVRAIRTVPALDAGQVAALGLALPSDADAEDGGAGTGTGSFVGGIVPTSGHEFVVAALEVTLAEDVAVSSSVRVGDAERPVPALGPILLVSAPTGVEVVLSVLDAERTQSVDLRSGEFVGERTELYHPVRAADIATMTGRSSIGGDDPDVPPIGDASLVATGTAELRPHTDALGWARPGRGWLVCTIRSVEPIAATGPPGGQAPDPARSLVVDAPGASSSAVSGVALDPPEFPYDLTWLVVFDVPDSTTSFTVRLRLAGQTTRADTGQAVPWIPAATGSDSRTVTLS